ncbi:HMG-box protein STE11 [Psilocybe cubensis]|uniref:HMG-box protein STE11 n=2 Tax=Psilocybe cubensis TaxID=181762 RepID=A0ACB8H5H9_PSICU|nr:HMG-box protein STE11 [Psilocybe cubensis]KAH9482962.1 HMG-box protein STE11 [Psilocybe cubensis]
MSSPRDIKTEDTLHSRDSHSPIEWPSTPTNHLSIPNIVIPQARMSDFSSEVPVSKVAREARRFEEASYQSERREPFMVNFSRNDSTSPQASITPTTPTTPTHSRGPSPSSSEPSPPKVARPPNAFMIFRSWWLKQNEIPKHVEKRQQALSRVAGQVWGLLEESEKQKWHLKASEIQRKHKEDNPDYKFVPSPRGSRKNKDKSQSLPGDVTTAEDQTKLLRERYTKYAGPSPIPTRKKQAKKSRSVDAPSPSRVSNPSVTGSPLSRSAPTPRSLVASAGPSPAHGGALLSQPEFPQLHLPPPPTLLNFDGYSQGQFSLADANVEGNKSLESIQYNFGNNDQSMMFAHYDTNGAYQQLSGGLNAGSWTQQSFAGTTPQLEAKLQGLHQQLAGPFSPPAAVLPQNTADTTQIKDFFSFPALENVNFNLGTGNEDAFFNTIFHPDLYAQDQVDATPNLDLTDAHEIALHLNQVQYNFADDNLFSTFGRLQ